MKKKSCSECLKPKKHLADIAVKSDGTVVSRCCWQCFWGVLEYYDFYTDAQINGLWKGRKWVRPQSESNK